MDLAEVSSIKGVRDIVKNWLVIVFSVYAAESTGSISVYLAAVFFIATRQHALFILVHDAVHGLLFRDKISNEFLSDVFCGLPLFASTSVYRDRHLAHHQHLNTSLDPDLKRYRKWYLYAANKTQTQRLLTFYRHFWIRSAYDLTRSILAQLHDALRFKLGLTTFFFYLFLILAILNPVSLRVYVLYWMVPMYTMLYALTSLRLANEHYIADGDPQLTPAQNHWLNWIYRILFAPHNANLHASHHFDPKVPRYYLPLVELDRIDGC